MRMEWSHDDLVALWTLVGEDWSLVGNKTGATRLGFAVLLKFFAIEARFPRSAEEVPPAAVAYLAEQLKLDPELFTGYDWKWAPQGGEGQKLVRELNTLPGVENVALAPSQGH
jgi:hypothetical protein